MTIGSLFSRFEEDKISSIPFETELFGFYKEEKNCYIYMIRDRIQLDVMKYEICELIFHLKYSNLLDRGIQYFDGYCFDDLLFKDILHLDKYQLDLKIKSKKNEPIFKR